jgi:hypothetical protein
VNDYRDTYTYDANGNRLTKLKEQWQTNAWVNDYRDTYTYDANGNSITGKIEKWQNNWLPDMDCLYLISQKEYICDVYCYRYTASYKSFNTGIPEIDANTSLIVFPNPSTQNITIKYNSFIKNKECMILIYNIQGQLLLQQPLHQEKQCIDISSFSKGIYLLKLMSSDKTETIKIIKE